MTRRLPETPPAAPGDERGAEDVPESRRLVAGDPDIAQGWIRRFVRRHGVIRTTAMTTFASISLSLLLSILLLWLRGLEINVPSLIGSVLIPAIAVPLMATWMWRVLSRLDQAEELQRREIKDRIKAELLLRTSEERFRAPFEQSKDMLFLHDFQGKIIAANRSAREELNRDSSALLKISFLDLGDKEELSQRLQDVIDSGSCGYETALRTSDGRVLVVDIDASVIDRKGNLIQAVVRDISARKEVEQTLRLAKEASEAASRLKSRFVFNVSHDLRTPLNGIIGFTEAILNESNLGRAHEHAKTILRESESLLTLLNDLLDLAKIESGKIVLEPHPLDLKLLAASAVSPFTTTSESKGVELTWTLTAGTPQVIRADQLRLRQILLNLLSNAVKFTERGAVELTIARMEEDEDEQDRLFFSVTDTGIGIDSDKQETIFRSFVQARPSSRMGGTGLGTTIARELVTLMGGEIGLLSIPDKGSTFWFTVPLEEAKGEAPLPLNPPTPPPLHQTLQHGRLLLVEDYPTNQTIARLQLEGGGHEVTLVENGAEAVQACRRGTFDLLLMDLQMPVMGGLEATREIRALAGAWKNVPIIAMTASADANTRETCLHNGMNDVIIKPLHRDELLHGVDMWLGITSKTKDLTPLETDDAEGSRENNCEAPRSSVRSVQRSPEGDDSSLDFDKALDQLGGNRPLLEATLLRFVKQTVEDLASMREHAEAGDHETLRKEAHKLRGAAAYLAAKPLAKAASALEQRAAEAGDMTAEFELFTAVFERLRRVVEEDERP